MANQQFGPSIKIGPILRKNTSTVKNCSDAKFLFQMGE